MNTSGPMVTTRPQLVTRCAELPPVLAAARAEGKTIGLVPTMGALHEGHLSLVCAARVECTFTAVTIFVNPTQFAPHEDLDTYPRTLERDMQLLQDLDVDLVFVPAKAEIYPPDFSTYVEPPEVARTLEGDCRPGHFRGVATVVLKLFHLIPANVAFFGQKDYQQSVVIRHMVRDLNLPIDIRVCPIVREADGLAMSSRNTYLSEPQRQQALSLSRSLRVAGQLVRGGERDAAVVCEAMRQTMLEAGLTHIDYAVLADPETSAEVRRIATPVMALVAAHVGQTRLIDNQRIE